MLIKMCSTPLRCATHRVMAMLQMKKIIIKDLEKANDGNKVLNKIIFVKTSSRIQVIIINKF
jgi:hypothetical protein